MKAKQIRPGKKNGTRSANGKRKQISSRSAGPSKRAPKKLVREMYGGELYEYYPLGKYIVAAPGVSGGKATFKYTRIRVDFILDLLASGRSIRDLTVSYRQSALSEDAIKEAIQMARKAFMQVTPAARVAT